MQSHCRLLAPGLGFPIEFDRSVDSLLPCGQRNAAARQHERRARTDLIARGSAACERRYKLTVLAPVIKESAADLPELAVGTEVGDELRDKPAVNGVLVRAKAFDLFVCGDDVELVAFLVITVEHFSSRCFRHRDLIRR